MSDPPRFVGETSRQFTARFFDQAGNQTSRSISLRFHCEKVGAAAGACEGVCRSLATSTDCGQCGNRCGTGLYCSSGEFRCAAGTTLCGSSCVNTKTSREHCGGCNRPVPDEQMSCVDGVPLCSNGGARCAETCVDTQSDAEHCGGCGESCAQNAVDRGLSDLLWDSQCSEGRCVFVLKTQGTAVRSCGDVCGQHELGCERLQAKWYCSDLYSEAEADGCAHYQMSICYRSTLLGGGDVAPLTLASQQGWCGYPEPYGLAGLTCFCQEP